MQQDGGASRRSAVGWSGPAAAVGGLLWVACAVLAAVKPTGCVGDECLHRPIRDTSAIAPLLLAAVLLIAVGFLGLVLRVRASGPQGRLWGWALVLVVAGAAALVVGGASNLVSEDLPPFFVIPGLLVFALGLLLVGIEVFHTRVVPRWTVLLLIVGALSLVGANDQDARVLLTVPFGLAWLAVGFTLWRERSEVIPAS